MSDQSTVNLKGIVTARNADTGEKIFDHRFNCVVLLGRLRMLEAIHPSADMANLEMGATVDGSKIVNTYPDPSVGGLGGLRITHFNVGMDTVAGPSQFAVRIDDTYIPNPILRFDGGYKRVRPFTGEEAGTDGDVPPEFNGKFFCYNKQFDQAFLRFKLPIRRGVKKQPTDYATSIAAGAMLTDDYLDWLDLQDCGGFQYYNFYKREMDPTANLVTANCVGLFMTPLRFGDAEGGRLNTIKNDENIWVPQQNTVMFSKLKFPEIKFYGNYGVDLDYRIYV